jgi:hypothetical protein
MCTRWRSHGIIMPNKLPQNEHLTNERDAVKTLTEEVNEVFADILTLLE